MPPPPAAQLEIVRNHPQDIQDRPVYLWVDGEKWDGVLRYGATFTRELPPGRHCVCGLGSGREKRPFPPCDPSQKGRFSRPDPEHPFWSSFCYIPPYRRRAQGQLGL
jgi:hypothetical protein